MACFNSVGVIGFLDVIDLVDVMLRASVDLGRLDSGDTFLVKLGTILDADVFTISLAARTIAFLSANTDCLRLCIESSRRIVRR